MTNMSMNCRDDNTCIHYHYHYVYQTRGHTTQWNLERKDNIYLNNTVESY